MCKQLGIARAAYYRWKHRIVPQQEQVNQEIAERIKEYDERYSQILGQCKKVCVFGKKYLFFGKNQDMKILIEKEYFLCQQQ